LKDSITRLGYSDYFRVLDNEIRTKNLPFESTFIFDGLNDLVVGDMKSMEGIDVVNIGEAENLTKNTADILFPTIRKPGSEIQIVFNPKFEKDYVYQFCIVNPPENMIVEQINYMDAPASYLSDEARQEIDRMKNENIDDYNHFYLGFPRTTGLFFTNYGKHNIETPFVIPEQDDNCRIIAALDHGIVHHTVFSLAWLSPSGMIHNILTYYQNGGTTRSHAEAIIEAIEACRFSRYMYPCEVYYDYAMDTKKALNEHVYRSDLDEYIEAFNERKEGKKVLFIPANKRKVDGCHSMKLVFSNADGEPIYKQFDGLNEELKQSVKEVITDKLNAEIYAKMEGDDGSDALRYLVMGALVKMQSLNMAAKSEEKRPPPKKKEPLTKQYGLS
jgi:PBSX family phage terminase large subunit